MSKADYRRMTFRSERLSLLVVLLSSISIWKNMAAQGAL